MDRTIHHTHPQHRKLVWTLGILSMVLMSVGYILYIQFVLADEVIPNTTSWLLWALGGFVEAWSFYKVVQISSSGRQQIPFSLAPLACAVFAVIIAIIGLAFGKFSMPHPWEFAFAALDIGVVAAYFTIKELTGEHSRAARTANLLMVIDIFLSFIPIWVAVWLLPSGEQPFTWLIWTASYVLLGIVGSLQVHEHWKERRWLMIYPFTSAIFHGAIAVIVLIRPT